MRNEEINRIELTADIVLYDLRIALSRHHDSLQGENFRISWLTIVSLLRAIGHILKEVDSKKSTNHQIAINELMLDINKQKNTNEPHIYWDFIKTERDRFLKNYDYSAHRMYTTTSNDDGIEKSISVRIDVQSGWNIQPIGDFDTKLESKITDGKFKGRNELELAWEATSWWSANISFLKFRIWELDKSSK